METEDKKNNSFFMFCLFVVLMLQMCSTEDNLKKRIDKVQSTCDTVGAAVELQASIDDGKYKVKGAVVTPEMRKNIEKCVEAGKTAEIKFDSGLVWCTSKSVGWE